MYRFQVKAHTRTGQSIGILGSDPLLGGWNTNKYLKLSTSLAQYPLWSVDIDIQPSLSCLHEEQKVHYQYVLLDAEGKIVQWENNQKLNRWIPLEKAAHSKTIIVDDGFFGDVQPQPYGYEEPGLKIVVIGSSVSFGQQAWLLKGWPWLLGQAVKEKYGHQLVNVSEPGANVDRTIARFPSVVTPEKPDIVIIALSLGNERLAYALPHEQRTIQRRFETGLLKLVQMTLELGALPIWGGVYPNGDYSQEHYKLLKETHKRMMSSGIPVLDWLAALDNGEGRWRQGLSIDSYHPNTVGHQLMFEAINLDLFRIDKNGLAQEKARLQQGNNVFAYLDQLDSFISDS
jgi:lysophospholipase L1-like esterase